MKKLPHSLLRWLPLIILLFGIILFFYFRLYRYFTFTQLALHRHILLQWTETHYALAILSFLLVYIISVTLSFPGATILTLLGGFLFGVWQGTLYVVIGATIGATLTYLAIRTSLGAFLAQKGGKWLSKLEKGFEQNAFSYMLVLRFIPIFPFWVINIAAGMLNVKLRHYFFGTLLGIIPGSLVYVAIGHGLGSVLDQGKTPDFSIIFKPEILLPLIGLSILSLIPVIYKKFKAKKHA
jgi:uncharacterized membrane protein YdjX (TVP38/TMEM64 family)